MTAPVDPQHDPLFRALTWITAVIALIAVGFVAVNRKAPAAVASRQPQVKIVPAPVAVPNTYVPQTRKLVVTAVPMLVHEESGFYDYLDKDFAKKGMLNDKEVWAFSPSTLTVYEGDTVQVTVINPGDDPHTFTIAEMNVNIDVQGQSQVTGSFMVPKQGLYRFYCAFAEHSPYMWGNLVVLPATDAPQG